MNRFLSPRPSMAVYVAATFAVVLLSACGGGGSSSGGSGTPPITIPSKSPSSPSPTPSPTASPSLTGTLDELTSHSALAGFNVTVGTTPNPSTCLSPQTATSIPCGVVASPIATTTTSASGTFAVPNVPLGTYMLTISNGTAGYATLHRTVFVVAGVNALGTLNIAQLTPDEQAWLVDINTQRATVAYPTSFGNLVIDEYAEEQARAEAVAIVAGTAIYGDPTEGVFDADYEAEAGSMYVGTGVADLIEAGSAYLTADKGSRENSDYIAR